MDLIQEVQDNLFQIRVPLAGSPLRELNSYFFRSNEKNVLVDTGFRTPECRTALEEAFKKLGVTMDNTDIILTHFHGDHSGLAQSMITEKNEIVVSDIDRKFLEQIETAGKGNVGVVHEEKGRKLIRNGAPAVLVERMQRETPSRRFAAETCYHPYTSVFPGDKRKIGNYEVEFIHTPGHTPGHMCLWIAKEKTMLLGDHVLFDISPNISDWPGMEDSLGSYLESLRMIHRYDVKYPLPGHREIGDFHGRIAELLEHHEERLKECMDIIASNRYPTAYDVTRQLTWHVRAKDWEAFPVGQKWFAMGECLAHLEHLEKLGRIRRHEQEKVWFEIA